MSIKLTVTGIYDIENCLFCTTYKLTYLSRVKLTFKTLKNLSFAEFVFVNVLFLMKPWFRSGYVVS